MFAEVKRFRRKKQDDIDDLRLRSASDSIVPYGDTVPLEHLSAQDQILAVVRKAAALSRDAVNILMIESSSSHCVEDCDVEAAVGVFDELVSADDLNDLRKLNGVLFLSPSYSCSRRTRVFFFETKSSHLSLPPQARVALHRIRNWSFGLASTIEVGCS